MRNTPRPSPRTLRALSLLLSLAVLACAFSAPPANGREGATQSAASEPRLVTQLGHSAVITSVAFSPDGRFILTGSGDNTARLWEAATGKELRRLEGHTGSVESVAFSSDGAQIATGGADHQVHVWEAATGREVCRIEAESEVLAVAFSPDARYVLTGGTSAAALLWDVATRAEVRRFKGHRGSVNSLAFSSDGRFALTGSSDGTARLWDVASGDAVQKYEGHEDIINAVALSRDGRLVLTGSADRTARLWNAQTGAQLQRYGGGTAEVNAVAFSPDGGRVVIGSRRGSASVLDALTGKEVRRLGDAAADVNAVAFSPDGRAVLTGSFDKTARLWDVATGREVQRFEGRSGNITSIAFSSDGRYILTGSSDQAAHLWDAASGKEARRFVGHTGWINMVAFSRDDRFIATASGDRTARVWDVAAGKETHVLKDHSADVMAVAFSPDGRFLLTGSKDGVVHLWELATGKKVQRFEGNYDWVNTAAFSPDSRYVLTAGIDRTARLWETATGKDVRSFDGHTADVWSVAFSPDGKLVATGSLDKTARIWDAQTGAEVKRIEGHSGTVIAVAFAPDGKSLLTGSAGMPARLWDVASGRLLRPLDGPSRDVDFIRFSADGRFVVTEGPDRVARLWEVSSGREIKSYEEHPDASLAVAFSPDSRFLLTASRDGSTRVSAADDGKVLCRLISFGDGTWAAFDEQGRYDASNGGDVEGLHWIVGLKTITLSQLKERYYEPGLLAKVLGRSREGRRDVSAFKDVKLFPDVQWTPPAPGSTKMTIRLKDNGGGIGKVQVFVNDKEVVSDARGPNFDAGRHDVQLTVDLAGSSYVPGQENKISVVALNADGYLSSPRGTSIAWTPQGEADSTPPELYAIVGGISDYAAPDLALNFAAKDAKDMAKALEVGAKRLFGVDKVHLTLLTTASDPRAVAPTKANFQRAFEAARKARPTDIFVVYLAGHGVTLGQGSDTYCYLTAEANSANGAKLAADRELREQTTITSDELADWFKQVPALKRVLMLDTCAAAAAAVKLVEKREVTGDQVRAIERLKDRTGYHILMGSAADAPSYEASQYGQGLLTYALLEGMKGAALLPDGQVDVSRLFNYTADQVPLLARNIGGIQKPEIKVPTGGASFAVGLITDNEKALIPLAMVKPIILRPMLLNADEGTDNLGLNKALRRRLRDEFYATARGGNSGHVFVDEEDFPGAIRPTGTYTVEGERVHIRLVLSRDGQKFATLPVEGSKDDTDMIIKKIMEAIASSIKNIKPGD